MTQRDPLVRRGATKREKYLERIHLLRTLVNYGPLHASDLADRANTECDHDIFDDLPEISRRGIGQKLQAMEGEGLVAGSFLGVGLPKQWEIVAGGRRAVDIFEQEDGENWRIDSEAVRADDPIANGTRWRAALETIARLPCQYPDDPDEARKMALDSVKAQDIAREALRDA